MERTKTLEQLEEQRRRCIYANGAFYGQPITPTQRRRSDLIEEISTRYYFNMKHYFGATTMAIQRGEWDGFPVPASIYAKKTEV